MNAKTDSDSYMEDLCRTCMTKFSQTKREIHHKIQGIDEVPTGCKKSISIMDLLQLVQPQIKVEVKDNLPSLICSNCIQKLLVTYEFIELYKTVDAKFRKILVETEIASNCELRVSTEVIQQEHHIKQSLDKATDNYAITKYEFEFEEINIDCLKKEEESENEWPVLENHLLEELSDKEWIPEQSGQSSNKNDHQEQNSDYKMLDDTINSLPAKIPTNISIKKKENEEVLFPVENSDGSISCQQCESVFENAKLWQEHMQQHRLIKLPKRKYGTKSNKTSIIPSIKKGYECEHCGKGFSKQSLYKIHMRVHTGEEPYLCIECGKGFKNSSSLSTHMLRHKGEKNFQCPHCPKKFVCSSGLYNHMLVHTKEKAYVCDICGSAFHMACHLRKHNLYHDGIKNYQCQYCDMKFVTRAKQRQHMRIHTGEKPYRCKYCERAFAQSNDCVKHLRQHLGDNVYQCELCSLRFPLARDLRAHFATHKDDDEETRARNLEARIEEERKLQTKLGCKKT